MNWPTVVPSSSSSDSGFSAGSAARFGCFCKTEAGFDSSNLLLAFFGLAVNEELAFFSFWNFPWILLDVEDIFPISSHDSVQSLAAEQVFIQSCRVWVEANPTAKF